MKKQNKKPSSKHISIKMRILVITTLPLLFACVVITAFASWTLQKGLQNQIFSNLKASATGALISLDSISADSFHLVDDNLYKGDYNVTEHMDLLDYYAESNEVELTFFYGDTRRATTIRDSDGNRLVGTTAAADVVSAVLNGGKDFTTTDIEIGGEDFYGYYMPVTDTEGNIVGMAFAGKPQAEVVHFIQVRINFLIIIAFINYISCVILAVYVSNKHFIQPVHTLNNAAKALARGNTRYELQKESNDEFGDLTDSFCALMDNINAEANVARQMAAGDLTVTHQPVSDEDIMGQAITRMVHDNNCNLSQINEASEKMVTGVEEIATASNSLAQGTTEQASAIEEITSSISGIADSARINAEGANRANTLVKKTHEEAAQSNRHMNDMMAAMQDINDASANISKIMKIIDDIASQTNIISLNASVEAARAGEHGKGFAVVAEEIRNLAAKSAEAASDSAKMIEDSIKKTENGLQIASKTAQSLDAILASVEEMTALINEIAELSVSQSTSVEQVNTGIRQIADVLQTNSATSEECAATSSQLSELAEQLKGAVAKYKLRA